MHRHGSHCGAATVRSAGLRIRKPDGIETECLDSRDERPEPCEGLTDTLNRARKNHMLPVFRSMRLRTV
jgi:hypothetical protein